MFSNIYQKIYSLFCHNNPTVLTPQRYKVNSYYSRQLSENEIKSGEHRLFVGGLWEEIGILQFDLMKRMGLRPEHKLIDIGCGAMRGGLHFVKYLERGNYYGLDINASLIDAANLELSSHGLLDKNPHLLVNNKFEFFHFGVKFDYAIALSVFTHLDINHILRCLVELNNSLKSDGKFYATFFEAPKSLYLNAIEQHPEIITNYDEDPFHYSMNEMSYLADQTSMVVTPVENWIHPRNQKMLCFTKKV